MRFYLNNENAKELRKELANVRKTCERILEVGRSLDLSQLSREDRANVESSMAEAEEKLRILRGDRTELMVDLVKSARSQQ